MIESELFIEDFYGSLKQQQSVGRHVTLLQQQQSVGRHVTLLQQQQSVGRHFTLLHTETTTICG